MKRTIILSMIALAVLAAPALAGLTTKIKVTDGPGLGGGGAFWAEVVQGTISYDSVVIPTGAKFLTFCVENDEFLNFGQEYWVEVDIQAVQGGSGGPSPDPLHPISAALYTEWLALGDMTNATATKYQLAIWQQEAEAVYDDTVDFQWEDGTGAALDSAYQGILEATIDALITGVGSPSGIGNVRVLTLWGDPDQNFFQQDILVVPTPVAVLLGIIGLGVAGWKLRKYA